MEIFQVRMHGLYLLEGCIRKICCGRSGWTRSRGGARLPEAAYSGKRRWFSRGSFCGGYFGDGL